MTQSLERRLSKVEDSLFPSYPTNSGACKLAKKYDSIFKGHTLEAMKFIDKEIRAEAARVEL